MGSTLRYAGLLLAIVLALIAQQLAVQPPYATWGWILFAVAAVLGTILAPAPEDFPPATGTTRSSRGWVQLILGAAAIVAGATAAGLSTGGYPMLVFVLWLTGFLLATLALWGRTIAPPARARLPWTRREALILAAIMTVALVARTAWLDDVPRYYFDDESRVGMYLRNIFNADRFPNLFSMGWNSWPVLGMALQGIVGLPFGVDTTTLRLSSALAGTVAVLFSYLLARELFSPRIAILAAVLFACGRTALDFSRMGICHAQVLTFETLALWSMWRAVNSGSGVSYLWTGIGLGLCLHTYNAGQLLPLLWLGWVGITSVAAPRLALRRWRGGLITVAGLVFTVLPFALYVTDNLAFGGHWDEYTGMARNRQVISRVTDAWSGLGPMAGLRILGEQARLTWLGFNVLPADAYALGYRGGGMLDHVSGPLFVLGLAIVLVRFWRPRYAFLLYWWLLTAITGGVITQAPPAFVRMVGILPALALFAALPLDGLLRLTNSAALRMTSFAVIGVLGVAMVWDNVRTYFLIFPSVTSQPSSELVRYLASTPPNSLTMLLGAEHFLELSTEIYRLNLGTREFTNVGDIPDALPLRESPKHPIVLLFGETQFSLLPYAQSLYSGATAGEVTERGEPKVLVKTLLLSPEQIAARQGLAAAHDGRSETTQVANPFADTSPFPNCTEMSWTGGIYWPSDRAVKVYVDAPPTTEIALAQALLPRTTEPARSITTSVQLVRGWTEISIREQCAAERQLTLRLELDGRVTPFAVTDLRPDYAGEGLLATYLRNETPMLQTTDAQINAFAIEELLHVPYDVPVHMPFTMTWSGSLDIEVPGEYQFEAVFSGPVLITIDGEPLIQETVKMPEEPRTARAAHRLEKGAHALFALWDSTRKAHTSRRIFQLFWTPPNGTRELIPPKRLRPAQAGTRGALPTISIPPTPTPIVLRNGPSQGLTSTTAQDVKFGFAAPRIDKSWSGAPITMRGIEYEHGIGAHAWAQLTYAVPPNAVELQAIVGLADDVKDCPRASVRFEMRDEQNTLLYDSGVMDVFAAPKVATAKIEGLKTITLGITDAGDGIDCDHANWAEPSFLLRAP